MHQYKDWRVKLRRTKKDRPANKNVGKIITDKNQKPGNKSEEKNNSIEISSEMLTRFCTRRKNV